MPVVAWVALAVIWGLTWLAVRIGLNDLPPITFAGIRFLIASALLLVVMLVRRVRLPRSPADWRLIIRTAILTIGVAYAAQFWGQQYVTSGLTAVMFSTVPLFTLMLAHVTLPTEPLTRANVVGVLLGMAGVALIFSDQLWAETPMTLLGCTGFLIGSLAMASAQVTVKSRGQHLEPLVLASAQMAIGGALLLVVGLQVEGGLPAGAWTLSASFSLAYLSVIGSALAFFLFYWLLRRMHVTKVMSMALVHPLVAVVAGWIVLRESLSWRVAVGALGIIGGLALILRAIPSRVPVGWRPVEQTEGT